MCGMAAGGLPAVRVKLYELSTEYQWSDKGCGYLQCVRDNDDGAVRLVVQSETDSAVLLLESDVRDETQYKKQQDTLILWTEPDGRDLALSFQEKVNCDDIWGRLLLFQGKTPPSDNEESEAADTGAEDADDVPVTLPPCKLGNLSELAEILTQAPLHAKERLAMAIIEQDYIPQLLALFRQCDDAGSAADLGALFQVFKAIFLLNESSIFELLLQPAVITDVIGTFEYDPDLPEPVRHRRYLEANTAFREVVPFNDADIVDKIKLTHHVQYIKDVILAKVLDETTVQILSSFVFFNHNDILRHISGDVRFQDELFTRIRNPSTSEADLCELVMFVRACVTLKAVQQAVRASCFRAFCSRGLFDVFPLGLRSTNPQLRLAVTEILGALLSFDAHIVRTHIKAEYQTMKRTEEGEVRKRLQANLLIRLIVERVVGEEESALNGQMGEILRTLLDTELMEGYSMTEKSMFLGLFYDECFDTLVELLASLPEDAEGFRAQARERKGALYAVVDLLTAFVTRHANRVRNKLLRDGALIKVARLVELGPNYVALAAVRLFKAVVGLRDEFYLRYIVENPGIMAAIARAFAANGDRYNMLNSAILDLCEQANKAKLQRLTDHIVENHWEAFRSVHYVPTFREILESYQQQHPDSTLPWVVAAAAAAAAASESASEPMDVKEAKTPDMLSLSEDEMAEPESLEDTMKKRKIQ